jgi:hypothetical protein
LKQLLAKARARVVRHLVLDKGTLALTIGMGGLVVLLLIGTQVLDWYWPVLLAAVSLGVGLYQLRQRIPSVYQLAQRIDRRMALADSLSTAVYFSEHPPAGLEPICAMQANSAERLAAGVNLEQALPFARPRHLYVAMALLAVASALFVVRYAMIGSLDLNASLLRAVYDTFFMSSPEDAPQQAAKLNLRTKAAQPDGQPQNDPSVLIPPDAEKGQPLAPQEDASQQKGDKSQGDADQNKDGKEQGDGSDENGGADGKDPDKRAAEDKGQQESQSEESPSVLDKLRDAVNNLMNKLSSGEGQEKKGKPGDKQKGQKQDKSSKGEKQEGEGSEAEAQPDQTSQGDESKEAKDAKQSNAPGRPSDQTASGAGENEGKKDIEEAKAQAAMGKVSEMLAKRGDEVKGQVMVEVKSTKQTLRTQMTQQQAGHTEAGGEIHRDQVPLADQLFVERYFKEIRKAAAPVQGK